MTHSILVNIVNVFSLKKVFFYLFLFAVIVVLALGISKIKVNESVFSTLPEGETFTRLNDFLEKGNINNQVLFSLSVQNTNEEEFEALVLGVEEAIKEKGENLLRDIKGRREDIQSAVSSFYYQNFPLMIDSSYYREMDESLTDESIERTFNESFRKLISPGGALFKEFILRDPLLLTASFFKEWGESKQTKSGIQVENGFVFSNDKKEIILTAKTNFDSGESNLNEELYKNLEEFKKEWNEKHLDNEITYFGTFQIAAENRIQIRKDTFFTMIVSIVAILMILFIYYRKILIPLFFMLPVVFGALFSLGLIGYFKPDISGISLATGAVVLGIILDYSFHFFTHLKHVQSIKTTVKEIGAPLLIGSFTTITAFAALLFVDSVVLQDFGLFASLSLTGAAIFTLVFLPVILIHAKFKYENLGRVKEEKEQRIPNRKFRSLAFVGIILLTGVFLYFSFDIEFDDNLDNLSYHPSELKMEEESLTGINPEEEKKIYVFAEADSFEKASEINYSIYQVVNNLDKAGKVSDYLSAADFIIPGSVQQQKRVQWMKFWQPRKEKVCNQIAQLADSLGFNSNAFQEFNNWVNQGGNSVESIPESSLLSNLGIEDLIHTKEGNTTFITSLIAEKEKLEEVKSEILNIEGAKIFDRAETAGALIEVVKGDFNYILLVSSLIVFITLLLIYGRIELTLLAFVPMVISWIWILGIAALLEIKFNFVNVVISTFIFGLGDDFSIFITDGLLAKYKYKKESLGSFKTAIMLSAITTVIGTGVLFFAGHPAIKSVSVISVLGIVCILVISLIFQPILFNVFVQNRVEKKRPPVTLLTLMNSLYGYAFFISGCGVIYGVLAVVFLLPIGKRRKKLAVNQVISWFGKAMIYAVPTIRKRMENLDTIDYTKPSLIIANHSSFLDILLMIMLNKRVVIMVKDWVYNSLFFGYFIRYAGYIYTEDGPEENLEKIKERIEQGYSVMIFPEGTRSADGKIKRFKKGAFYLAEELKLDFTPILIHGASYCIPKNDFMIKTGTLSVRALPRIRYEDRSWGDDYRSRCKSISKYFKEEYSKLQNERETPRYLWRPLFENYVFKGPVLEWYVRIKWMFESKNYVFYNELIGDRKTILDVGCGYGYLDFYLGFKNDERIISAVDYDEEKINIAQNCFGKTDKINFEFADIKEYDFGSYEVVFLNDVLHYFSKENQSTVLEKCYRALDENGVLIIRDGITDYEERHKTTASTEFFSTNLGFNVQKEEFYFFDKAFIMSFARENGLSFEMIEQSQKTSNVLFILRKV